jgi:hypothetical protein
VTQARRALLIGIEDYPHLPKLHGCVNDVRLMKEILQENFGFPEANITLLANEQATRDAILKAFDQLIDNLGTDDIVVLHYAGHGGMLTDLEGDEPSGLDSTIQPYDTEGYTPDNQGKCLDISDDELALKLDAMGARTRFITLIMDCCHSGTITRDALGAQGRSTPPDRRTPEQLAAVGRLPVPGVGAAGPVAAGPSGWLPLTEKYVVISGCRDEEIAYEYRPPEGGGAVTHGALTWFLSHQLRQAHPGSTYRDVFERAASLVNANNPAQRPQMEGKADREIFGVKDIVPTRYLKVTARNGELITLSAGAAQGVTVGSVYAIHPQGTKDPKDSTPLGEAEVVSLGVVTSEARLTEPTPTAVAPDSRAFETRHAFGEFRLAVKVVETAEAEAAPLRTLVEESPLLKMAGADEPAAITLRLLAARETVSPTDPIPRAGPLPVPVWAATAESGDLAMKLKPRGDEATVRDNLETIARYRQALALANPDANNALLGKFTLELLKLGADGKWIAATPNVAGGEIAYTEGEPIGFRVTSSHDRDAYVALVDFEANGAVTPLRPDRTSPAAQEKLRGGQSYDIGPMAKPVPTVTWPAGYPYVDTLDHLLEAEAVETIKLFVTEQPADFSVLTQKGVRGTGTRKSSPLGDLLNRAFQGHATRGVQMAPESHEGWTTVARSFVVRRRAATPLAGDGKEVEVGNLKVAATGVSGTVTAHLGAKARQEAAESLGGPLAEALGEAGAQVRQSVSVSGTAAPASATRGATGVELRFADPGPGLGQLVMTTDDLGVVGWHLAPPREPVPGSRGAITADGGTRRYLIPPDLPAEPAAGATTRGSGLADFGNKVVREIVFPLMDPILGKVSSKLVGMLEQRRFPYRIRPFAPANFAGGEAPPMDGEAWRRLGQGRALLLLHGPMSRSHMGFGGLPVDYVQELNRKYDGRVIGFDHFTLSHDPKENARRFLEELPEGTTLDLDIISHSRGGLVSRVLVEKQDALAVPGRRVRIGKCIFVGAPNGGTPLADPASLGRMVDVITNILTFIPVPYATEVLRILMAVLKQAAVGALTGLDGLTAMSPGGKLLPWLNDAAERTGDTRYFAVAGDATPATPGLRRFIFGRGVAKLLGGPNDFVVPVTSVSGKNGSIYFPIEDTLEIKGNESVSSVRYFEHAGARMKILEWLGA